CRRARDRCSAGPRQRTSSALRGSPGADRRSSPPRGGTARWAGWSRLACVTPLNADRRDSHRYPRSPRLRNPTRFPERVRQPSVGNDLLAGGSGFPYGLSHKLKPEGEIQMAYSLYDAAVTPCAQQLGALAGIIDKAAAHCAANKIEESVLLQDRLYPDMFCLARQIRQSADFAMNTGGRRAGVAPPALPAVDDTSFAAAKSRVETALGFVKSLTRAQVDGAEGKVIAWTAGGNDRKLKANDYLQQFALPNFFFFVTT